MQTRPERIRRARLLAGLNQTETAARVALSPSQYARIEKGISQGSIKTLHRIAEALDVPFVDIVDLDGEVA